MQSGAYLLLLLVAVIVMPSLAAVIAPDSQELHAAGAANERSQPPSPSKLNHNKIVWCEQSLSPKYNLALGANCPQTSTLIANPNSFRDFRKVFCVLKKYYQQIKYKHVLKIKYGPAKFPNLAYHSLKWSIINLKPDPDLLWLVTRLYIHGCIHCIDRPMI